MYSKVPALLQYPPCPLRWGFWGKGKGRCGNKRDCENGSVLKHAWRSSAALPLGTQIRDHPLGQWIVGFSVSPRRKRGSSAAEEQNVGHSDVSYVSRSITGVKMNHETPGKEPPWLDRAWVVEFKRILWGESPYGGNENGHCDQQTKVEQSYVTKAWMSGRMSGRQFHASFWGSRSGLKAARRTQHTPCCGGKGQVVEMGVAWWSPE